MDSQFMGFFHNRLIYTVGNGLCDDQSLRKTIPTSMSLALGIEDKTRQAATERQSLGMITTWVTSYGRLWWDMASSFIATNAATGGGTRCEHQACVPSQTSPQAPVVVNSLNPSNFYTNLLICYPSSQMLKGWEVETNTNHSSRRFLHSNLLVTGTP